MSVLVAGHQTGDVYYVKRLPGGPGAAAGAREHQRAVVYAANVDTGAAREVVKLPPGRNVSSLNADETLLLGTYVDGPAQSATPPARSPGAAARFGQANYEAVGADGKPMTFADAKDLQLHNTLMATRAGAPRVLFTVNTKTGETQGHLSGARVAGASAILSHRPQPHHVLSRGYLARGRSYLDNPTPTVRA